MTGHIDVDEENTNDFNPLVPRAIDLPTTLPAGGVIADELGDVAKIFAAPDDPADWPAWRADLATWRTAARKRLHYSGSAYDERQTRWSQTAYSVAQIWLWDERLYDFETGEFTPDRFVEAVAPHGGFDGVVLWHAYPIIGIDDRNQFDFYRSVPGLAQLVRDLRDRGIRVFVDYNPWDTGTRREADDDATELAALVTKLGVDGVFLDTMKEGNSLLTSALRNATPPQVLEGESRVPNARVEDHLLSWAQWFADSPTPGVMRAHWYERRHMMHGTRRWNRDHSDELQSAWMNGTGILVWDAVFGVWVGWNARDRATHRRMLRIQRGLSAFFVDGDWSPLDGASAIAIDRGVFATRWTLGDLTLWTLVNRGDRDFSGPALSAPLAGDHRRFDLGQGIELDADELRVPARGVTAVLDVPASAALDGVLDGLAALLAEAAIDEQSGDNRGTDFPAREAVRVVPSRSTGNAESDAIRVPAGAREFTVTYRRRETGWYQGAPYVEQWKPLPPRLHDPRSEQRAVALEDVAVAASEVSVGEWNEYLDAIGRSAEDARPGDSDRPASGMTLGEARAYARWRGGRLPTEFEWQAAAEIPGFERRAPLVWNWTESEHSDGITRFAMLKGGADYAAEGSDWYFDGGPRDASFSAKYLLSGLQASPNLGFRLAWDEGTDR